jgi:hypothetical protein
LRRLLVTWNPLEDPSWLMPTFRLWRRALKVSQTAVGIEGRIQRHGGNEIVPVQPTCVFPFCIDKKAHLAWQDAADDPIRLMVMARLVAQGSFSDQQ